MKRRLKELESRQLELQRRAAVERSEFARHFGPLEKPLSWADKGMNAIHFIKDTPILWTSAFAVLSHYKPKLASKALAVGWGTMKLLKSAKSLL